MTQVEVQNIARQIFRSEYPHHEIRAERTPGGMCAVVAVLEPETTDYPTERITLGKAGTWKHALRIAAKPLKEKLDEHEIRDAAERDAQVQRLQAEFEAFLTLREEWLKERSDPDAAFGEKVWDDVKKLWAR